MLISNMLQPAAKVRRSGREAGIQAQGCKAMSDTAPKECRNGSASYHPLRLCSGQAMALDTGIHAGVTVLAEDSC